jgi:hypothetical protein
MREEVERIRRSFRFELDLPRIHVAGAREQRMHIVPELV